MALFNAYSQSFDRQSTAPQSSKALPPAYRYGTHRLIPPEQTLAQLTPYLSEFGITRLAEVTRLDVDLGVPTYCAIRPAGLVLQTSNGKGLTPASAKVSALMEAIELHHAEHPEPKRLVRSSLKILSENGLKVIRPEDLERHPPHFFSDDFMIDWVEAEELISQQKVWLPASAAYFCEQSLLRTSTNGLASGNHLVEATLHALYELIERDAISRVEVNGRLKIKETCKIIDLTTITNQTLQQVIQKIQTAQSKLLLLWTPSCVPVHTFWAVLLNQMAFSAVSTFNMGYGTHFDIHVAAARAITEAVQSRLTLIHGAREDIIRKPVYKAEETESSRAYRYFDQLESNTPWQAIETLPKYKNNDLWHSYDYLRSQLRQAGHYPIFRVDLTHSKFNIPVVKVIIPSLRFKRDLF